MWRTANNVGVIEDRAFGSWTRDEIDEALVSADRSDAQWNRMQGARQAAETNRQKAGPSACPECGAVFQTPQGRGGHVTAVHRRSLRSA